MLGGGANRLTLNNSTWDRVNVEIVVTKSANCADRGPEFVSSKEVVLRKDKSEVVDVPPEAAVCWRHDRNPSNPKPGDWTGWSRATLYPGQSAETEI
jgi:hypothetical protein